MEKITLVDIFDNETGTAEKLEAHRKPMLHRAFSVFVHHGGRMLIQKRAAHKYHSGGLWGNACCSHPRENELLEDAVHRRLCEELGMQGAQLKPLFSFVYYHKFHDDLYEYELDHVFLAEYERSVTPNPDEISEIKWVDFAELAALLRQSPEQFVPWFPVAAPSVLSHLLNNCGN